MEGKVLSGRIISSMDISVHPEGVRSQIRKDVPAERLYQGFQSTHN